MITDPREFNRFCRDCRYTLRGVASRKCPECGGEFDPADPRTTLANPHTDAVLAAAVIARTLIVISGAAVVMGFVYSATAFVAVPFCGAAPLWLVGIAMGGVALFLWTAAALHRVPLTPRQRGLAIVLPLIYFSIPTTQWPLRLSFLFHKSALMELADQTQANGSLNNGGHVGLYRYHRIVRDQFTGNCGFQLSGDSGGGIYLVRAVAKAPHVWNNTNWEIELGDNWYLVFQD